MSLGKMIMALASMSMLVLIVILGYQFGFNSVASTDIGVNLSGTQYQTAYNQSVNTSQVAFSFVSFEGMIIGVVALILTLLLLAAGLAK